MDGNGVTRRDFDRLEGELKELKHNVYDKMVPKMTMIPLLQVRVDDLEKESDKLPPRLNQMEKWQNKVIGGLIVISSSLLGVVVTWLVTLIRK